VKARFAGKVTLSDLDPPHGYTISGEGQGGAAGFAKGGAEVRLEEDGNGGTVLRYTVKASIGGRLAQIGARLVDGTARKLSDQFFDTFSKVVSGEEPDASQPASQDKPASEEQADAAAGDEDPATGPSLSPAVWVPALIGTVGILLGVFGTA
jgi:hypothetical protein